MEVKFTSIKAETTSVEVKKNFRASKIYFYDSTVIKTLWALSWHLTQKSNNVVA